MKKYAIALAAVLPLLAVAPAAAQRLEPGRWTGKVTSPGETTPLEVTYDVSHKGDTTAVSLNAGENGSFPFSDVKLSGATLTFWFMPGTRVECTLTGRPDGVFFGNCLDAQGGLGSMVMIPPKKE
jgi:hypothetical protein